MITTASRGQSIAVEVELGSSWCADLPVPPHPDLDEDDRELVAGVACLQWVDVLADSSYAPLDAGDRMRSGELDDLFDDLREVLDDGDGRVDGIRGDVDEPADRRAALVLAAQTLVSLAGQTGALGEEVTSGGYRSRTHELDDALVEDMRVSTWQEGCPIHLDELRLVEVVHHGFDGDERWGQLVVHADVADDVAWAFGEYHAAGFSIERIEPIERYGGDDDASMEANNTSAFNCRATTGSDRWSEHAYGWAIDINPVQNPYVRSGTVVPERGREYVERSVDQPGMLTRPGAVDPWDELGWGWGGDWSSLKDYQHVSLTGR